MNKEILSLSHEAWMEFKKMFVPDGMTVIGQCKNCRSYGSDGVCNELRRGGTMAESPEFGCIYWGCKN
jgi:hypothetical protein